MSSQAAELQEQLNGLVELPLCTRLNLVEPPVVAPCVNSAEHAIALAVECSPEVFQADQDAVKAEAGVRVAKVDWLPDVLLMGGYVNQNGINVMQNDVTYGAVSVNYPLFEGGKRIHALHQAELVQTMARQKACQVREEVSLKGRRPTGNMPTHRRRWRPRGRCSRSAKRPSRRLAPRMRSSPPPATS